MAETWLWNVQFLTHLRVLGAFLEGTCKLNKLYWPFLPIEASLVSTGLIPVSEALYSFIVNLNSGSHNLAHGPSLEEGINTFQKGRVMTVKPKSGGEMKLTNGYYYVSDSGHGNLMYTKM